MHIPAWAILSGLFGFFFFILSIFASSRGIPLLKYWSVPLAAVTPWLGVLLMVIIWTNIKGNTSQAQAMAMSALFPMLGVVFAWIIGSIVSFFVSSEYLLSERVLWSFGISAIPAVFMGVFLVYGFIEK